MRSSSIAIVAALALMSAPAFAQTAPSTAAPKSGMSGGTTAPSAQRSVPNPLMQQDVSKISGTDVYGSDDKKVGSVSTELMNPESKTIDRLVLSTGGVLGVGAHDVAVPIDKFSWDSGKSALKISSTADELKSMPQWQEQSAAAPNDESGNGAAATPAPASH